MGLYDRDYGRNERTSWDRTENPRSVTVTLVVINVVVFLISHVTAERILDPGSGETELRSVINEWCAVDAQSLSRPWMIWQCLTYGFVHDITGYGHILFNMFGLFIFGRHIEQRLGQKEFLRFYLVAIVIGGVVGAVTSLLSATATGASLTQATSTVGASGGVLAVVILFACYYPNQELLLMFVLPIKAWVLAVLYVTVDLAGALGIINGVFPGSNTAFTVHLAGSGFGALYHFRNLNLRWIDLDAIASIPAMLRQRSRRMKLKLHDPDRKFQRDAEDADQILAKIHEFGESSLTSAERKTLERYSRRQREKRDG